MRYMRHRSRAALAVLGALAVHLCGAELLDGLQHHHHGDHGLHRGQRHHGTDRQERRRSGDDGATNHFTCMGRPPGYYADMQLDCQIYHLCNRHGTGMAFECPGGTRFQQRTMVCDHWNQVKCSLSDQYYAANLRIGQKHLNFIDDVPAPTMQLVIRDDIDLRQDTNIASSSPHIGTHDTNNFLSPHQTPPPAPASSHQVQRTRRPAPSPSPSPPPSPAPPFSHRHPRMRPDFMQLIFKETNECDVDAAAKNTVGEEVSYSDHELFRETERDLKPWQRYFRNVFHQRGITSRPSSNHQKLGPFQQQRLSGRSHPPPPPPPLQRPQRRQKSSPLRSLPFPSSSPVPASARGIHKGHPRPPVEPTHLPLGLVPPSHPINQVLPASARVLGVSPAKVGFGYQRDHDRGHGHGHGERGPPRAQTAVMSLDAFLREFPDTKKMKTIPVEVSGRESDVVARLASGERDRELELELDDLIIATRAERKIGPRPPALRRHRGEIESAAVTVRPRGGNEPFFFSSDGGLSNSLESVATFTQEFATTPRSRSPFASPQQRRQQNNLQQQQRHHELSFAREPHLEFGFRPLQDNPFFFTTTEKPRDVKDRRDGRGGGRGGRQHLRPRHRHVVESGLDVGFRDISAVAADAVRKVKATQFDMRNLFFIPPERGKPTRNNSGRKKKRKNAGHGFFTP